MAMAGEVRWGPSTFMVSQDGSPDQGCVECAEAFERKWSLAFTSRATHVCPAGIIEASSGSGKRLGWKLEQAQVAKWEEGWEMECSLTTRWAGWAGLAACLPQRAREQPHQTRDRARGKGVLVSVGKSWGCCYGEAQCNQKGPKRMDCRQCGATDLILLLLLPA